LDRVGLPTRISDLLLTFAGRIDDDALIEAREFLAVAELARAVELLLGCIGAGPIPITQTERDELAKLADRLLIDERMLDRITVVDQVGPQHRFTAGAAGDPAPEEGVLRALTSVLRVLPDVRGLWCVWRTTPAGAVPGPVPQRVVLIEVGNGGFAPSTAYRAECAMRAAGIPAVVEVLRAGGVVPAYHDEALAAARAVPLGNTLPPGGRQASEQRAIGGGARHVAPSAQTAAFQAESGQDQPAQSQHVQDQPAQSQHVQSQPAQGASASSQGTQYAESRPIQTAPPAHSSPSTPAFGTPVPDQPTSAWTTYETPAATEQPRSTPEPERTFNAEPQRDHSVEPAQYYETAQPEPAQFAGAQFESAQHDRGQYDWSHQERSQPERPQYDTYSPGRPAAEPVAQAAQQIADTVAQQVGQQAPESPPMAQPTQAMQHPHAAQAPSPQAPSPQAQSSQVPASQPGYGGAEPTGFALPTEQATLSSLEQGYAQRPPAQPAPASSPPPASSAPASSAVTGAMPTGSPSTPAPPSPPQSTPPPSSPAHSSPGFAAPPPSPEPPHRPETPRPETPRPETPSSSSTSGWRVARPDGNAATADPTPANDPLPPPPPADPAPVDNEPRYTPDSSATAPYQAPPMPIPDEAGLNQRELGLLRQLHEELSRREQADHERGGAPAPGYNGQAAAPEPPPGGNWMTGPDQSRPTYNNGNGHPQPGSTYYS
jgi:hypothetical protein